jgi:hypothetical protein
LNFFTSHLEAIIAELYEAVVNFSQRTPQKDDLTAVLIKRFRYNPRISRQYEP